MATPAPLCATALVRNKSPVSSLVKVTPEAAGGTRVKPGLPLPPADGLDVHGEPAKVDDDDRFGSRREAGPHRCRRDAEGARIDVGEDGRGAAARDRLGGRVEGEGRADHLVPRADLHCIEREHERVGAVGDADRARHAELLGNLCLERLHVRPQDEDARVEHTSDPLLDLRNQALVLSLDVYEGNVRHDGS